MVLLRKVVLLDSAEVNVRLFAETHNVSLDEAVEMIVYRYCLLSFRERLRLEQKIFWREHRNKGFRSLPQFIKSSPPAIPQACAMPKLPSKPKPKRTKKAVETTQC